MGSKRYESKICNFKEIKCVSNIIIKKQFWKKYNCKKIKEIRIGNRMYSIDMQPFYKKSKNIITIMGGSSIGCILAPYISKCIISEIVYSQKISPFDFSEKRAIKNYIISFILLIILVSLIFIIQKLLF